MPSSKCKCYRCAPHDTQDETSIPGDLESIETTLGDGGEDVFFASGYSAREIAQKRARETNGAVYVNNVSRKIKRPDLTVPVAYAVAKTPVYTLCKPDEKHDGIHRVYWRPL
jgi:hypothetical protein